MKNQEHTCQNCQHWKNGQLELSYQDDVGFCAAPNLEYDMVGERPMIRLLDRGNPNDKYLRTNFLKTKKEASENNVPIDRYSLVTTGNFGCVNFEAKPPTK